MDSNTKTIFFFQFSYTLTIQARKKSIIIYLIINYAKIISKSSAVLFISFNASPSSHVYVLLKQQRSKNKNSTIGNTFAAQFLWYSHPVVVWLSSLFIRFAFIRQISRIFCFFSQYQKSIVKMAPGNFKQIKKSISNSIFKFLFSIRSRQRFYKQIQKPFPFIESRHYLPSRTNSSYAS